MTSVVWEHIGALFYLFEIFGLLREEKKFVREKRGERELLFGDFDDFSEEEYQENAHFPGNIFDYWQHLLQNYEKIPFMPPGVFSGIEYTWKNLSYQETSTLFGMCFCLIIANYTYRVYSWKITTRGLR